VTITVANLTYDHNCIHHPIWPSHFTNSPRLIGMVMICKCAYAMVAWIVVDCWWKPSCEPVTAVTIAYSCHQCENSIVLALMAPVTVLPRTNVDWTAPFLQRSAKNSFANVVRYVLRQIRPWSVRLSVRHSPAFNCVNDGTQSGAGKRSSPSGSAQCL